MPRRHDHDAGGEADVLAAKAALRNEVWAALKAAKVARFPGDTPRVASSIKGASKSARRVDVDELTPVDLVVAGSVAVSADGARLGKGGGFSDLEFAIARRAGLIGDNTIVVSTVHELQVVEAGRLAPR